MSLLLSKILCVILILQSVISSPLTFQLTKEKEECVHLLVPDTDCTIKYNFDINNSINNNENEKNNDYVKFNVYAPGLTKKGPIISNEKQISGQWSFIGEEKGEYSFCFELPKDSAINSKTLSLEIEYLCDLLNEHDKRRDQRLQDKKLKNDETGLTNKLQTSLEDSIDHIERQLYVMERDMGYYMTRNIRNQYTVNSTEHRISMFSIYGILLIVLMSVSQIVTLQWFFKKSRNHKV